jgi:hypothetical protein
VSSGKLDDGVGVVPGHAVMSEQGVQEGTEHVYVYLDNILIFSRSAKKHVLQVLQRLLENQLFVQAKSIAPPSPS